MISELASSLCANSQTVPFILIVIIIVLLETTDHDHDPLQLGKMRTEKLPSALLTLSTLIVTTHDRDQDQHANDRHNSAGSHFAVYGSHLVA